MSGYRTRAAAEIKNEQPSVTLTPIMRKLVDDTVAMLSRGPEDAKARATAARAYSVANLEALHVQVKEQFARRGIGYHRAATAEEAVAIMLRLLAGAKRVAKSKSMVGEEVGLTHSLRGAGIDLLETDIGEYIVDIEGRGPSHITAPAIHLNRTRIQAMLNRTGAEMPDDDPVRLSRYVRDVVGTFFKDCDAGITGANAVIASSGRVMAIENEGNVALGGSHPRLHIAITGIEKVVADEAAALSILEVLAPSATAQPLTSFSHFFSTPAPGQERHVVFVDNGRSRILKDPKYADILKCIRCGACMNGCPVYRAGGGLSYGSPYMGPIGAVLSPLLWPGDEHADLPFASSLCGRCTEVCPVGIPLHRMLLDLRSDAVATGRAGSRKERTAWRGWALTFSGATRARLAMAATRLGLRGAGRVSGTRSFAGTGHALPVFEVKRDPAALVGRPRANAEAIPEAAESPPADTVARFRTRAESLGVQVVDTHIFRDGDLVLEASGAVASTGSVLLTGAAAARRALLGARRVVVKVDPSVVVGFPHDLAGMLGDEDALILTGASRTADIEKIIVRGIHGSEELMVVMGSR